MLILKKYHGEIDWNVGTLFSHTSAFIQLLDNCKNLGLHPKIKYVFGSFTTKWNSGRHIQGGNPSFVICQQAIDLYNSYGISARFTFSNHLLNKDDLSDPVCNETLEYMDSVNASNPTLENGTIVVSDMLTAYIRKNYPHIKITSSLYKPGLEANFETDTYDYYNRLIDIYDMVVVDTNKVKDKNLTFLEKLKDKDKVEFIANNHCVRHCKNVGKHDEAVAQSQLAIIRGDEAAIKEWDEKMRQYRHACHQKYLIDPNTMQLVLTDDEINMLIDIGYKHFKLQGRAATKKEFFEDLALYVFDDDEHPREFRITERNNY